MGLCPHHCPKPAAAGGGLGAVVAVVGGVFLLSQYGAGVAAGIGELVHAVLMIMLVLAIATAVTAGAYVAYRVRRRAVGVRAGRQVTGIPSPAELPVRARASILAPPVTTATVINVERARVER